MMKRYAVINTKLKMSDGVYFYRDFAEEARKELEEFSGLDWEIVEIETGFKPGGFSHLGEHGIRQRLARATADG